MKHFVKYYMKILLEEKTVPDVFINTLPLLCHKTPKVRLVTSQNERKHFLCKHSFLCMPYLHLH